MLQFPSYVGPTALGIKMGVIVPGIDLAQTIVEHVTLCNRDGILSDGDVLCVTESVVARAQNNIVTLDDVSEQVRAKMNLQVNSRIGVVFPILSRNRFAPTLEAIAKAVPEGEVVVQLSWPRDEVGNQIISDQLGKELNMNFYDVIYEDELEDKDLRHPITKVNYINLYRQIITSQGAKANIYLANDANQIMDYECDGIIVADIHTRHHTYAILSEAMDNLVTLADICSDPTQSAWSEWGLLGSNMSATGKLKLAPHSSTEFAVKVQEMVKAATNKQVEVIVYGDGAYKDPATGIYELADPEPVLGSTNGFEGMMREGIKYKYIADMGYYAGKTIEEIESSLEQKKQEKHENDHLETEGTTPRELTNVIASLADLVSGSSDAGTPLVIVKGFLQ